MFFIKKDLNYYNRLVLCLISYISIPPFDYFSLPPPGGFFSVMIKMAARSVIIAVSMCDHV